MMTVSNMLASCLREANKKIEQGQEQGRKERWYEYRANVNHAVGVLKDQLSGILFMFVAPLEGWRRTDITEQRTRKDWAGQVKRLVDEDFPLAEKIIVVG